MWFTWLQIFICYLNNLWYMHSLLLHFLLDEKRQNKFEDQHFKKHTSFFCSDDITRQYYYLQVRKNIVDRGGSTEDGDQNVLPLVALGLQADLGDHTTDMDISSELLEQYLPTKVNTAHRLDENAPSQRVVLVKANVWFFFLLGKRSIFGFIFNGYLKIYSVIFVMFSTFRGVVQFWSNSGFL